MINSIPVVKILCLELRNKIDLGLQNSILIVRIFCPKISNKVDLRLIKCRKIVKILCLETRFIKFTI